MEQSLNDTETPRGLIEHMLQQQTAEQTLVAPSRRRRFIRTPNKQEVKKRHASASDAQPAAKKPKSDADNTATPRTLMEQMLGGDVSTEETVRVMTRVIRASRTSTSSLNPSSASANRSRRLSLRKKAAMTALVRANTEETTPRGLLEGFLDQGNLSKTMVVETETSQSLVEDVPISSRARNRSLGESFFMPSSAPEPRHAKPRPDARSRKRDHVAQLEQRMRAIGSVDKTGDSFDLESTTEDNDKSVASTSRINEESLTSKSDPPDTTTTDSSINQPRRSPRNGSAIHISPAHDRTQHSPSNASVSQAANQSANQSRNGSTRNISISQANQSANQSGIGSTRDISVAKANQSLNQSRIGSVRKISVLTSPANQSVIESTRDISVAKANQSLNQSRIGSVRKISVLTSPVQSVSVSPSRAEDGSRSRFSSSRLTETRSQIHTPNVSVRLERLAGPLARDHVRRNDVVEDDDVTTTRRDVTAARDEQQEEEIDESDEPDEEEEEEETDEEGQGHEDEGHEEDGQAHEDDALGQDGEIIENEERTEESGELEEQTSKTESNAIGNKSENVANKTSNKSSLRASPRRKSSAKMDQETIVSSRIDSPSGSNVVRDATFKGAGGQTPGHSYQSQSELSESGDMTSQSHMTSHPGYDTLATPRITTPANTVQTSRGRRPRKSISETMSGKGKEGKGKESAAKSGASAAKTSKPRNKRTTDHPPRLPRALTKSIFSHFTSLTLTRDALNAVEKVADKFWSNMVGDLSAYAAHARRATVEEADLELLMNRQGFTTDQQSMHTLIEKWLPLEYRTQLIPMARAGGGVVPPLKK